MTPSQLPPAPSHRTWYAVHGGRRYRVACVDGVVVEADSEIVAELLGAYDCAARAMLRAAGARIDE